MTLAPDDGLLSSDGTAQAAAERWVRLIVERNDLPTAWPLMDPDHRGELTRAWVQANRLHRDLVGYELDRLAIDLAQERPDHPLWPAFRDTQLEEILDVVFCHVDLADWGWMRSSRPRSRTPPRPQSPLTATCAFGRSSSPCVTGLAPGVSLGFGRPKFPCAVSADCNAVRRGVQSGARCPRDRCSGPGAWHQENELPMQAKRIRHPRCHGRLRGTRSRSSRLLPPVRSFHRWEPDDD
jgi:hypothetical protein